VRRSSIIAGNSTARFSQEFARRDLRNAAELIAEVNGRAADDPRDLPIPAAVGRFHAYMHVQRVAAPITDALHPRDEGTVPTAGIANYVSCSSTSTQSPAQSRASRSRWRAIWRRCWWKSASPVAQS
jgi:hypothetical protein